MLSIIKQIKDKTIRIIKINNNLNLNLNINNHNNYNKIKLINNNNLQMIQRRFYSTTNGSIKPFLLADIGEGITGCEIVKWLVKPGQKVSEFDPIAEVQSDKATVEITSPYDGIIDSFVGQTGQVVRVGDPLCMILVNEESSSSSLDTQTTPDMKSIQEDVLKYKLDDEVDQNQKRRTDDTGSTTGLFASMPQVVNSEIHSTPSVRRLAHEHQLDITKIIGTGKQGRITKEDVLNQLLEPELIKKDSMFNLKDTRHEKVPLGLVRQAMFRGMTQSLRIPHFGYSDQIDVTELERIRQDINKKSQKISLLSFFIKFLGKSMEENELFRCTLSKNEEAIELIKRPTCDISIAINSPIGLLTPLIPQVETKSVVQIAHHITALREFINSCPIDKIPRFPDELGGNRSGTITLSNIGNIGGTYTHPVIPPTGQLAIGAIGSVKVKPEYCQTEQESATRLALNPGLKLNETLTIQPRLIVEVSFTADHRLVQGVELAQLVASFKNLCQNPRSIIPHLI